MLLTWVREITAGYEGVNIERWGSSFRDGLAFLAMIDQYSKRFLNGPLYDYNDRAENYSSSQNVNDCLEIAERNINIPKLIEADPLITGDLEDRGLVLYVSMFFHAFVHAEEKRNKHEVHEQEIVTLRNTAEEELTNVKERLEEALEQKIRMENLYSELENKYMLLQREFDQYVLDSKSKISQLEHKNQDEETRSINLAKELEVMREQFAIEKQQSMHALELLRKKSSRTHKRSWLMERIKQWSGYFNRYDFSTCRK
jgi:hypothetical protein